MSFTADQMLAALDKWGINFTRAFMAGDGSTMKLLSGLLGGWLPRQRWFPVKSAEFSFEPAGGLSLAGAPGAASGTAELEVLLLAVSYPTPDGSRTDVVQVPLSIRRAPLAGAEPALIGEMSGTGPAGTPEARWIYDGVHDPAFIAAWLELMRTGGTTTTGNAAGHLVESGFRLPRATGLVKVLTGEQSNSSVIVDDAESAAILKFFRVLSDGDTAPMSRPIGEWMRPMSLSVKPRSVS